MNISGFWTGRYSYYANIQRDVGFHCNLVQADARLEGCTTENNSFCRASGQILIAKLIGTVIGDNVVFMKTYTNVQSERSSIFYSGALSKDETFVVGFWRTSDDQRGRFKMTKAKEQVPMSKTVFVKQTKDA